MPTKEYYAKHREECIQKSIVWAKRNPEKRAIILKRYYSCHKKELIQKKMTWAKRNPEKQAIIDKRYRNRNKSIIRQRQQIWRQKQRLEVLSYYGGSPPKCVCCGESHIEFLTIDHMNNDGAKHRKFVPSGSFYSWLKKNNFPEDYQVLCFNCNLSKGFYGCCPHEKEKKC